MKTFNAVLLSLLALACVGMAKKPKADGEPAELAKYNRTGQFENCIATNRIQQTRILNNKQILFEMTGKGAYLNEPKKGCSGLRRHYALVYTSSINELCNTTIVRLSDPGSPVADRGSCNIGKFEKLEPKTETP